MSYAPNKELWVAYGPTYEQRKPKTSASLYVRPLNAANDEDPHANSKKAVSLVWFLARSLDAAKTAIHRN